MKTLIQRIFGKSKPQTDESMAQIWGRFEGWIKANANNLLDSLNEGASNQQIQETETTLNVSLPQDFIEFYKLHNGQATGSGGLIDMDELLSLEEIENQWNVWHELLASGDFDGISSEPSKGIKNDWWNDKWIPITHDGGGNHICIDLDPTRGGTRGQIIQMWHDSEERELIAPSFYEWMQNYVNELEKGGYLYSEEWGGIINKEDAEATDS